MDTKQPEALALAHTALQARNKDTPDDVYVALGDCAWALRNLHAEIETLRAGYSAARLEIESLQDRVQQLGQLARDVNSRRVQELEAQLAAVGAGGVEPLRKRCLHQISEPAQPVAQAAPEDASARFKAQHEFLIWNREQTPPPIESATEYSVFNQAVDFYIAARAAQGGA